MGGERTFYKFCGRVPILTWVGPRWLSVLYWLLMPVVWVSSGWSGRTIGGAKGLWPRGGISMLLANGDAVGALGGPGRGTERELLPAVDIVFRVWGTGLHVPLFAGACIVRGHAT